MAAVPTKQGSTEAPDLDLLAESDRLRTLDASLRRFVRHLVSDSEVDDLVQETWLVALKKERTTPREDTAAWLRGVARHRALKVYGSRLRGMQELADAGMASPAPPADESAIRKAVFEYLLATIEQLGPKLQAAVREHYLEGKTLPELACADGVPIDTLKSRVKRALQLLRRRLDREFEQSSWAPDLLAAGYEENSPEEQPASVAVSRAPPPAHRSRKQPPRAAAIEAGKPRRIRPRNLG